MKPRLLELLACPSCKGNLRCEVHQESSEIEEGLLICRKCKLTFPIRNGVPRMMLSKSIESLSPTIESFGFEWSFFMEMWDEYKDEFLDWVFPIMPSFFKDKLVLDAGCGMGRHTYYSTKFGAETVGIDVSRAVDKAYFNTRGMERAHIVQADIYNLPFKNIFDFVYSIGVLHHLPNPKFGFKKLVEVLNSNGSIFAWVYGKNQLMLNVIEPLRKGVTTKLPDDSLKVLSFVPTFFLFIALKSFYNSNPKLPFNPYFYKLSKFRLKHLHEIVFDFLNVPISNYYEKEEFKKWFEEVNLKNICISCRNKNSWRGFGTLR